MLVSSVKEIVVFSEQGEPRDIMTWSNVPYFLVKSLEERGVVVHTVNLNVQGSIHRKFRDKFNSLTSKTRKNTFYDYSRSAIYYYYSRLKIKRAIKKYKNADAFLFTTFSFSAHGLSPKPSILFCDWTIEHHIKYFLDRQPKGIERIPISRQNKVIEKSEFVFVLFPTIASSMAEKFSNKNIHYIGNVINSLIESDVSLIDEKMNANRLLFVGTNKYMEGAMDLVVAFEEMKEKFPDLTLDIIGIQNADFAKLPDGVTCHGYLNKGVKEDAEKYYNLLKNARLFINTTPKWGAFSASLEAMYFFTPVIVSSYAEFTETFRDAVDKGVFFKTDQSALPELVRNVMENPDYSSVCIHAHEAAKEHTWNRYVDNMIRKIEAGKL